jgi:hypothetical protein
MESIASGTFVYRGIRASSWVDRTTEPPTVLPTAFFLRFDETGLSVAINPASAVSDLNKHYGAGNLCVNCIRELGLDLVPDDLPHANITGVPHKDIDELRAERLAGLLAKQSLLIPKGDFT